MGITKILLVLLYLLAQFFLVMQRIVRILLDVQTTHSATERIGAGAQTTLPGWYWKKDKCWALLTLCRFQATRIFPRGADLLDLSQEVRMFWIFSWRCGSFPRRCRYFSLKEDLFLF